jgi:dihydrofolate reductase
MGFKIVAAVSDNNVIGVGDKLPWHIKEDLKRFKQLTDGRACLMGRKTYDSMKQYFKGEVLPGRLKYVLTRNPELHIDPGVIPVSFETALELGKRNSVFVIGGGDIYTQFIKYAEELYLTRVHLDIEESDDTVFFLKDIDLSGEGFTKIGSDAVVEMNISFDFELWERTRKTDE